MIINETQAIKLAEQLVQDFAEKYDKTIEQNRKNGDTLGVTTGIPLHRLLNEMRMQYLAQVEPALTLTTNYFNIAVVRYVLKREC